MLCRLQPCVHRRASGTLLLSLVHEQCVCVCCFHGERKKLSHPLALATATTHKQTHICPAAGRPILYSCSWPAYQIGQNPDYKAIAEHCNLWRNFDDIEDSWQSVLSIVDFYAQNQEVFSAINGNVHFFLCSAQHRLLARCERMQSASTFVVERRQVLISERCTTRKAHS